MSKKSKKIIRDSIDIDNIEIIESKLKHENKDNLEINDNKKRISYDYIIDNYHIPFLSKIHTFIKNKKVWAKKKFYFYLLSWIFVILISFGLFIISVIWITGGFGVKLANDQVIIPGVLMALSFVFWIWI